MSDRLEALRRVPFLLTAARSAGKVVNHTLPDLLRSEVDAAALDRSAVDPALAGPATSLGPGERDGTELPLTPTEIAAARNPAFTAEDVTDFGAVDFVADPFMLPGPDRWHLFFEVCNYARDPDAVIGHATSPDGLRWEYDRAVLNTGEHLSFPYVFEWEGTRYMVPEEGGADGRAV
ncbi:glucosamine inositolphosphorylceramide transferase family protein, partial [Halorubrum lipolyticum]